MNAHGPPMLTLTPILMAIAAAVVMYHFSAWNTARELDARSSPLADPKLDPVFRRLSNALDLPRLKVNIYEVEPINGLAAPDGRIFLTRGFYRKYQSGEITAEELASVVAHELGHVALGHSKRRMTDFSGQNAIRTALSMVLGRFIPIVGILIANMLTRMLAAHLSRSDEYEADAYAAALMTKAGLGVEPQMSLLAKLDRLTGAGGGAPVWLASHPAGPETDRGDPRAGPGLAGAGKLSTVAALRSRAARKEACTPRPEGPDWEASPKPRAKAVRSPAHRRVSGSPADPTAPETPRPTAPSQSRTDRTSRSRTGSASRGSAVPGSPKRAGTLRP